MPTHVAVSTELMTSEDLTDEEARDLVQEGLHHGDIDVDIDVRRVKTVRLHRPNAKTNPAWVTVDDIIEAEETEEGVELTDIYGETEWYPEMEIVETEPM